ncbi:hypothetical protein [Desulfurivibrio sp. C05AmB]|uniref:hypothetical protein n=1 Tax=Desulfurivibrio sp. C05AmB TaxID=3374371 RepID=UPI00376EB974
METEARHELIADECLLIGHAGEIPEIAYYGSLYYLGEDPEGPALLLTPAELAALQAQVISRYREIMLRDLNPANRGLPVYRGIRRVIWNWERLGKFLRRHGLPPHPELEQEMKAALQAFLANELQEVRSGASRSCLNCTVAQLTDFLKIFQLGQGPEAQDWLALCCR